MQKPRDNELEASKKESEIRYDFVTKIKPAYQVEKGLSRGIREDEARFLIVLEFLDDVLKEIPLEYPIEFNKLIRLEMNKYGAVG